MNLRRWALGVAAAACLAAGATPGHGADGPEAARGPPDLTILPPVPKTYRPRLTSWGEPDLRGTWPLNHLAGLPLQRSPNRAGRVFLTEEEFQQRETQVRAIRAAADEGVEHDRITDTAWTEMTGAGRRTSLLVDPPSGRLPELTEEGKRLNQEGRSSYVRGRDLDWVTDFDTWERCITRGFPASMLPFSHDNGLRIFQSPGVVAIQLEMIHETRIIPIDGRSPAPSSAVRSYMGSSRGHWEGGNTLVIETTNIHPGASPLNQQTIGAPRGNTLATSLKARVTERLTMTGPDSIVYEMTYDDPVVWTAPFTVRLDWRRDETYRIYEYACHEGNHVVRSLILASRFQRAHSSPPPPKP